jgi:hypothetical protein
MDADIAQKLERLRSDFSEITGRPFTHFFCPVLFKDEVAPLCRAHLVNVAFADSTRRWTIQRQDVDNFFGSVAESDFVDLQDRSPGIATKALFDPRLHRKFRPRILFKGKRIDYFVAKGQLPKSFTPILFEREGLSVRLGLKLPPSEVASSSDADWQIEVNKDVRLPAIVSVIKMAHLTLFEMFGYRYALSRGGMHIGQILGSFFVQNVKRSRSDVLKSASSHFGPFAAMIRPVQANTLNLRGTIEDGYAQLCWLEGAQPERPWAMIVFVRTGRLLHAALMPMFDDIAGVERFGRLLKCREDKFVTSLVQFKNDRWLSSADRAKLRWPADG